MRSGGQPAPDLLEQMGYETRDVVLPRIFFWIGVLFVFAFGGMLAAWLIYILFIPNWATLGKPSSIPINRRLPPHPQLQLEPRRDMALYRTAEDNALNAPGIDRAIDDIAANRGISGVRGTNVKGRGDSYPGSGNYARPGGGETGNTNLLPSSNNPQVGEKPLPGGVEQQPGTRRETPALGNGTRPTETAGTPPAEPTPAPSATPATP